MHINNVHHGEYGEKHWIEHQIIVIIKAAMHGRPARTRKVKRRLSNGAQGKEEVVEDVAAVKRDHQLALSALMQLAKLKGFIIEKRQSTTMDLSKLPAAQMKATLSAMMDQLKPGERQKLLAAMEVEDIIDVPAETPEQPE